MKHWTILFWDPGIWKWQNNLLFNTQNCIKIMSIRFYWTPCKIKWNCKISVCIKGWSHLSNWLCWDVSLKLFQLHSESAYFFLGQILSNLASLVETLKKENSNLTNNHFVKSECNLKQKFKIHFRKSKGTRQFNAVSFWDKNKRKIQKESLLFDAREV